MKNHKSSYLLRIYILVLSVYALDGSTLTAATDTLYVNANTASPGDGSSWSTAFDDLQDAIDMSNTNGGGLHIWVAEGTYHPTLAVDTDGMNGAEPKERTFYITQPVEVYGGFTSGQTMLSQRDSLGGRTILTGALSGSSTDTAYHVVTLVANTIASDWRLDGLTIRDGRATGTAISHISGAGIYVPYRQARIFTPVIQNCVITNNIVKGHGGGIYASVFDNATSASSESSPIIKSCVISDNMANLGAGIYLFSDADVSLGMATAITSPTILNSVLFNNGATSNGGGVYIMANASAVDLANANAVASCNPTIASSTFYNNMATSGGGMFLNSSASAANVFGVATADEITNPSIYNTILWGNTAYSLSNGLDISKNNSNNSHPNGAISHSTLSFELSVNGTISYTDTLLQDPMFMSTLSGADGLRLQSTSPAINKGDNTQATEISLDLLGNPRVRQDTVDMGAYEGISCAVPDTLYVNVDNANPTAPVDGSSWASALTNLQEAIDISNACAGNKEIWVAKGTYRTTFVYDLDNNGIIEDRERTFYITHPVQIYGGFEGDELERSERDSLGQETILTAAHPDRDTAFHVMFMTADSITSDWILDGLRIEDGLAFSSSITNRFGGGLYARSTSGDMKPTIKNCSFSNNTAQQGGGIYFQTNNTAIQELTSPQLINCTFTENSAGQGGGVLFNGNTIHPKFYNCNFSENSAANGGGISSNGTINKSYFSNCNFTDNTALISEGGGIHVSGGNDDSQELINCVFTNNSASRGGGLFSSSFSSSPQVVNSTFSGNSAVNGGGIYVVGHTTSHPQLTNCIFWENEVTGASIEGPDIWLNRSDNAKISHSIVTEAGLHVEDASGTIDTMTVFLQDDPMFANAMSNDLRLLPNSPAMNAGINDSIPDGISSDLDGNPRIRYGTVDMGAYEGVPCISSDTLYVDIDNTTPAVPADGSSWTAALTDLQEAIDISNACEGGKEIWVAKGTYHPTFVNDLNADGDREDRERTFYITHPAQIYGGFEGDELERHERDSLGQETILTAAQSGRDTAYHVMFMKADSITSDWVIDGLRIKDGRAFGNSPTNQQGGGLFTESLLEAMNLTIKNSFFENNLTLENGGGIYVRSKTSAQPYISRCNFSNNSASRGGGIYIEASKAIPNFSDCIFYSNSADISGGGVYADRYTTQPVFNNCSFENNTAGSSGGGIYSRGEGSSSPELTSCRFTNNSSNTGGAVWASAESFSKPKLTNCTMTNNLADEDGGAIYISAGDVIPHLTNSTIVNNVANRNGGGIFIRSWSETSPQVTNCILWNNSAAGQSSLGTDIYLNTSNNSKISHSIVTSGGIYIDDGSAIDTMTVFLHDDPMLIDTMNNDLRLLPTSPAINAGINDSIPDGITTDLDGNPRVRFGTVDIGAYEGVPCISSDTLFVNIDNITSAAPYDGSSWASALSDLQEAINISNTCEGGKEIWVAKGTYHPTFVNDLDNNGTWEESERTFYITHPVQIYGGFDGNEIEREERDSLSNQTILSGASPNMDTAYHVMFMSADSITRDWVIDGVMITDGRAEGLYLNRLGGGLYARSYGGDMKAIIKNVSITNNSAYSAGGGIHTRSAGATSPILTNCTFTNNSAFFDAGNFVVGRGGGILISGITSNPLFSNCTFTNNYVGLEGGAVSVSGSSVTHPELISCSFMNNSSEGLTSFSQGGALFVAGSTSITELTKCNFTNNSAFLGGGLFARGDSTTAELNNCTFSKNSATLGGGIYAFGDSLCRPELRNCTISNNSASDAGGGIYVVGDMMVSPQVTNSIFWGNQSTGTSSEGPDIWLNRSDNAKISHSIVTEAGLYVDLAGGTIDTMTVYLHDDPMLVDTMNNDLRLLPNSPAINAGINDSIPDGITTDLDGNPRIMQGIVDMGAYEVLSCAVPDRLYVNGSNSNPAAPFDGSSWASAFTDLQEALDLANACEDSKEIWVAKGTYHPTFVNDLDNNGTWEESERTFYITHPVQIYGGFDGNEVEREDRDSLSHETILTGASSIMDTAYHVMFMSADSITCDWVIDGVMITHGRAKGSNVHGRGGGLYANSNDGDMKAIIKNVSLTNNSAYDAGGGIQAISAGTTSPILSNCTFTNNSAFQDQGDFVFGTGGAISIFGISSNPLFTNCTFTNNYAGIIGGAVEVNVTTTTHPKLAYCSFTNNSCIVDMQSSGSSEGGALFLNGPTLIAELTHCNFTNNNAYLGGGFFARGVSTTAELNNCTFSKNSATLGGGIYAFGDSLCRPELRNCTLSNNSASDAGGGIFVSSNMMVSPQVTNSIFWGNQSTGTSSEGPDIWLNRSDNAKISHSIVTEAGLYVDLAGGTIDTTTVYLHDDPMLIDTMNNDLRLLPNSPAINAGINDSIPDGITTDLDGLDRINCDIVDMGAYEFQRPLELVCVDPITVNTDMGTCTILKTNPIFTPPSANCGITSVVNDMPDELPVGLNTVTWTITDTDGRQASCTQEVTVVDNQAPTISSCPEDVMVNTDNGSCTASGLSLGMPSTSDNCMVESITNNAPQDGIYNIGETMVRWIITDAAGLKDTCFQKVTVVDNQAPTITCAPDTTITTATNVVLDSPTISDNCTSELTLENNAPTVFVAPITTVTWTVTDVAGNMNTCDQLVTLDTTDPCEEDITIDQSPGGRIMYSTDMNIFLNLQATQIDTLLLSHGVSTQATPGFQIDKGGILEIRDDGCSE